MAQVSLDKVVSESPQSVWDRIGDFANPEWLPGVTVQSVHGEGPGARRVLRVPPNVTLTEILIDASPNALSYRLEEGSPLPISNYETLLTVADHEDGCLVTWTASFEPSGISEEATKAMLTQMITSMVAAI